MNSKKTTMIMESANGYIQRIVATNLLAEFESLSYENKILEIGTIYCASNMLY